MPNYSQRSFRFWCLVSALLIIGMIVILINYSDDPNMIGALVVPIVCGLSICLFGILITGIQSYQIKKFLENREYFVEWNYTPQEWEVFLGQRGKNIKIGIRILAIGLSVFFLFTGFITSTSFGHQELIPLYFGVVILFNIVIAVRYRQVQKRQRNNPVLLLGKNGYMLGGIFYTWTGSSSKMEGVEAVENTTGFSEIKIDYSYRTKTGRATRSIKFPVPSERKSEIPTLIEVLKRSNGLM